MAIMTILGKKTEKVKKVNQHIQQEYKPLPLLW